MPRVPAALTAASLRGYASRLHRAIGPGHHVASPLGAWLLLALIARAERIVPGSAGADALADALGCPLPAAVAATEGLMDHPHPAVRAAAAAWAAPELVADPRMGRFLADLPCETGPMPTQAEADAWARERTDGLVERYPIDLEHPPAIFTMATALVTRVNWLEPFDVVAAEALGPGPFAGRLTHAMRASAGFGHRVQVAQSPVGPVAIHRAVADGLVVLSVAAHPDVPAADVLDAAYAVASRPAEPVSLWDLPLGQGPAWTIEEGRGPVVGGRGERVSEVVLPAWSAGSGHDLMRLGPGTGFQAAAQLLTPLLPTSVGILAAQSAVARFHREGFEAAAVTAVAAGRIGAPPRELGPVRTARLQFGHPYAVLALATEPMPERGQGRPGRSVEPGGGPWTDVPVFSAWVAEVEEPEAG